VLLLVPDGPGISFCCDCAVRLSSLLDLLPHPPVPGSTPSTLLCSAPCARCHHGLLGPPLHKGRTILLLPRPWYNATSVSYASRTSRRRTTRMLSMVGFANRKAESAVTRWNGRARGPCHRHRALPAPAGLFIISAPTRVVKRGSSGSGCYRVSRKISVWSYSPWQELAQQLLSGFV
jgi:hypothetical protein